MIVVNTLVALGQQLHHLLVRADKHSIGEQVHEVARREYIDTTKTATDLYVSPSSDFLSWGPVYMKDIRVALKTMASSGTSI